jgi:hypothetical protein
MKTIFSKTITIFFLLIISTYTTAFADPEVRISQQNVSAGVNQVDLSIQISDIDDANMGGYILRLDYDDSIFENPSVITSNTLSQGLDVEGAVPVDGFGGKYTIGLMSGFTATTDGTLIKVRLEIAQAFETSDITFISEKTQLFTGDYSPIQASLVNGSLTIQEVIDNPTITSSVPTLNEYGIFFFISIILLTSIAKIRKQARQNI